MNGQLENLATKLQKNGFQTEIFATKEQARKFILQQCKGKTVGTGGSVTLNQMDMITELKKVAKELYAREISKDRVTAKNALTADVYLLSANAISEEDGTIVNIDGVGNRVAASIYGPNEVIFVVGKNKLCTNLQDCLHRVKNVATPKNVKRLGLTGTPCATADECVNCNSPNCICRITVLHNKAPRQTSSTVVLINEDLGL